MTPPRLVCLTDVPTPYRNHLFSAMGRELAARGVDFEVWFMARTAPGRFWRFPGRLGDFSYRIGRGLHPVFNDIMYHFNPGLLWSTLKDRPDWLLVGGGWMHPTAFCAAAIARWSGRSRVIFWSEANRASAIHARGPVAGFRRLVLRHADAFAVPGRIAEMTIRDDWQVVDRPFLPLPNVVDERKFDGAALDCRRRAARRSTLGLGEADVVFLWPARLQESTKGIINFLDAVQGAMTGREVIAIAGEGPDRPRIEAWIRHRGVRTVRLLGQLSEPDMLDCFGAADVLLLPSLRDANPLAIVEALWAGLPMVVSRHCGNWMEAVVPGENGWVVDPLSPDSMRAALVAAAAASRARRTEMGAASRRIAAERFSTTAGVRAFVDALTSLGVPVRGADLRGRSVS